jgi:hypothetical protein
MIWICVIILLIILFNIQNYIDKSSRSIIIGSRTDTNHNMCHLMAKDNCRLPTVTLNDCWINNYQNCMKNNGSSFLKCSDQAHLMCQSGNETEIQCYNGLYKQCMNGR